MVKTYMWHIYCNIHAIVLQLKLKEKDLRKMYNTPTSKRFNKSDFDEHIFPVLTCMSAYHTCLHVAKVIKFPEKNNLS